VRLIIKGGLHFCFFTSLKSRPIGDAQFFFGYVLLTKLSFRIIFIFSITCIPVLNMIWFPDRDPTGFCTSEPDPDWLDFEKTQPGQIWMPHYIDHCSKMLRVFFFGYKPDWIKYLDRSTGLGSD